MPQPRRDAVHRYFEYDAASKTSKCNLCGNSLKGKHTTNLKNHISIKHPEEYLNLINVNKENQIISINYKETITTQKIKNLCVRLVTTHGRPLAMLQDTAFQEIVNIAVPSNATKKHINLNVIKGMIPEKSYEIKSKIANEIKNTMISLKLDSATYIDRNFLGINLQYIKNYKIVVRNLAVVELFERQTGDFLKQKLMEVLDSFMISSAQIYSITTDKGSNLRKMTKLMTLTEENDETFDTDEETRDNDESIDINENEDDSDPIPDIELNLNSFIDTTSHGLFKPRIMLCAAHTLQLAVKDAISENIEVQVVIQSARSAVKILRRPNIKNILRSSNLLKPLIDCPTRWTSTYNMLVRLNSLKDIFVNLVELSNIFSDNLWDEISNIIVCLKPINDATLALQREQLTISDFYVEWLNCRTKVEAIRFSFADDLVKAMRVREQNLLHTDLVLENLYLDGRLNLVLSDEECIKAKSLITITFQQLQILTASNDPEVLDDATSGASTSSRSSVIQLASSSLRAAECPLENYLRETESVRALPARSIINSFETNLNQLRYEPRLPLHQNIISYWATCYRAYPCLAKIANIILAAPATQVSVERLFSSLKFILNPLRSNISSSLLQDIMLIRANHDLLE